MKRWCFQKVKKLISLILITFVFTGIGLAKDDGFKYETSFAINNTENEAGTSDDNLYQLNVSFFETHVGYGDYPFLLTNFFERRTFLDLDYWYSDSEDNSVDDSRAFYRIIYSYASVGEPIMFDMGVARLDGDGTDSFGDYEIDAVNYYFGFGYYVSPNTVAKVLLTAGDYELGQNMATDIEYDQTNLEVTWQHVKKIEKEKYVAVLFDVEAIEVGSSQNSQVGAKVDYYINRQTGFGAAYQVDRGSYIPEGDNISFNASHFIDTRYGFTAEFNRFMAETSGNDEDTISLKAIVRIN